MLHFPSEIFQEEVIMATANDSKLRAVVQTAEQAGGFVWVITLVDFGAGEVKRSMVSEENFATSDAARDAGNDRLKAMAAVPNCHKRTPRPDRGPAGSRSPRRFPVFFIVPSAADAHVRKLRTCASESSYGKAPLAVHNPFTLINVQRRTS
jgi:hypothetical protein